MAICICLFLLLFLKMISWKQHNPAKGCLFSFQIQTILGKLLYLFYLVEVNTPVPVAGF